ncbi:glycerophosphodiester phosphodiesterase [Demequina zhanjiangensis]|uniref:Glycerophosphodiester phosphodiesterase family protein n=1 Tax=Demequina zhanjiangensis TaxID=3051659 RepID=A0ABT8G4F9_9MICO|nr:glycerophosphodiester phosphodiesterase family protein [Demequina sp. SYSU T00b26]MDN4473599.1 glycerophosphodiester phosphodiesterase family protein [Demequina sp. SYSU T00b26]
MTQIWAHRGARLVEPENTLAAMDAAVTGGADGVELDVHLSADGRLVVRHDPWLALPDGACVPIGSLTRSEIELADVGDASSGVHRAPFLREVLDLLAATGVVVNIEMKVGVRSPYRGIASAVVDAVRQARMQDRVVLSSFDHVGLLEVRDHDAALELAPLYSEGLARAWDYTLMLGMRAAHPQIDTIRRPGTLESFRAAQVSVRPWTVNDEADLRMLLLAEVDAVIVDDPAAAVLARSALARERAFSA